MANVIVAGALLGCFLLSLTSVSGNLARCPENYCYRVEMCVMEAQVAPQAGGGLPLITDINKLEELCERGILQKTIDCLQDIYLRCAHNATRKQELDMLFSVDEWRQGQTLLCEDLNLFKKHFECVSKFGPRISSCILIQTQMFKKSVMDAVLAHFKSLHDITCNFAQNIVNCLEHPLVHSCPLEVVNTMVSAMHRFLPPTCAPAPPLHESENGHTNRKHRRRSYVDYNEQQEPMASETVAVEDRDGVN